MGLVYWYLHEWWICTENVGKCTIHAWILWVRNDVKEKTWNLSLWKHLIGCGVSKLGAKIAGSKKTHRLTDVSMATPMRKAQQKGPRFNGKTMIPPQLVILVNRPSPIFQHLPKNMNNKYTRNNKNSQNNVNRLYITKKNNQYSKKAKQHIYTQTKSGRVMD